MQYKFFLIIPPGFEDLTALEVEMKCPVKGPVIEKGGISLEADLTWMERAHTELKIPTRILLRITEFKVRDFPKLFGKIKTFEWNKYLSHPEPMWEISAQTSRLIHTGRIEETIKKALKGALARQPLSLDWQKKNYSPQTFYIRLKDDLLTLSLDLSGEPLYKRGLQTIKGEAPLRENFAAAMVWELLNHVEAPMHLVDPMCGSGTFLSEAQSFFTPLKLRPFAFMSAPFYKGRHLKLEPNSQKLPILSVKGFDLNEELLLKVRKVLPMDLVPLDSLDKKLDLPHPVAMICNPPYGERIKIEGKRGSFLKQVLTKFLTIDAPDYFAWVLPSDMDDLFLKTPGYDLCSRREFRNGGLPVTFWIWKKRRLKTGRKLGF